MLIPKTTTSSFSLLRKSFLNRVVYFLAAWFLLGVGCAAPNSSQNTRSGSYAFWPPFPNEPRIQYLRSYRFSTDIEAPPSAVESLVFGDNNMRNALPINKPYGIDMRDGRIYVCDIRSAGVFVLDIRKRETRLMGATGVASLMRPTDIAIAEDGTMYVADSGKGVVTVFDATERFKTSIRHEGMAPASLAVHGDKLYVCDFKSRQITVMDRLSGQVHFTIGGPDSQTPVEEGGLGGPIGIEVDKAGRIYVTDALTAQIQKYDPQGKLIQSIGQGGDSLGTFVRPKHMSVDNDGLIFVVDAAFQNVQIFDEDGKVLSYFGSPGAHPGAMFLPAGLCIREDDLDLYADDIHPDFKAEQLLLVTNQFGSNKVAVYAMGRLRKGKTVEDLAPNRINVDSGLSGEGDTKQRLQFDLQLEPETPTP